MTDDLTNFERELLHAVSWGGSRFGVATDMVDEELLEESPGRAAVESALRSLCARGLVWSETGAESEYTRAASARRHPSLLGG